MAFSEKQGLQFYQFEIFAQQPIFHAVLTRQGGFSQSPYDSLNLGGTVGDDNKSVFANHQKIFQTFNLDFNSRFDVWQVHGSEIVCAENPRDLDQPHMRADGILTDNPSVTLLMRFADCVPILLFDPIKNVIGIIHAGWQGTTMDIAGAAIRKLTQCYGSEPGDVLAAIGPSICQSCYEVGLDVYNTFCEHYGQEAEQFFIRKGRSLHLNLWEANRYNLLKAGVAHIEVSEICTGCHPEMWYSHRVENSKTGRFGVLMRLNADKRHGPS